MRTLVVLESIMHTFNRGNSHSIYMCMDVAQPFLRSASAACFRGLNKGALYHCLNYTGPDIVSLAISNT